MNKFKIEYRNPKDLIPYKLNAKTHPASQIALIKHSIDTFKPDQPIVIDENNVILKGHGRRLAAIELGMESFPVIIRTDLTEAEKRAARLADNRSAESPLDFDILKLELDELKLDFDIADIGFDEDFLDLDKNEKNLKERKKELKPKEKIRILLNIDKDKFVEIKETIDLLSVEGVEIVC